MLRAQIIRAMEAAGLHVEAGAGEVHGLADTGHVYARRAGGAWKLRPHRRSKVGTVVRTEAQAARACRALSGAPRSPALEVYHDGAETFLLEPVQ